MRRPMFGPTLLTVLFISVVTATTTTTATTTVTKVPQLGTFLGATPNGTSVFGIAVVDSLLHVVRENNTMVEVFRPPSNKLTQLMSLRVINQTGLYDMAHLPKANLLVLLNWFDGTNVIVMSLNPPYNTSKWTFTQNDTVAALSVTEGDERIVITESSTKVVKVFTKEGVKLREILLKTNLSPRQAIRTKNNLYAVTFGYGDFEPHYVCRFNVLGYVVGLCFGGRRGNSLQQLNVPARMLNAPNGDILVADVDNKRILRLKHNLRSATEVLTADSGINHPYRLAYYPKENVLYVADNFLDPVSRYSIGGRILAFQYRF